MHIRLLADPPDEAERVQVVSRWGLPGHDCILLITLGVGGIVCDLADGGVSQVVLTRLNLAQGELSQRLNSLAGISRLCGPGT